MTIQFYFEFFLSLQLCENDSLKVELKFLFFALWSHFPLSLKHGDILWTSELRPHNSIHYFTKVGHLHHDFSCEDNCIMHYQKLDPAFRTISHVFWSPWDLWISMFIAKLVPWFIYSLTHHLLAHYSLLTIYMVVSSFIYYVWYTDPRVTTNEPCFLVFILAAGGTCDLFLTCWPW